MFDKIVPKEVEGFPSVTQILRAEGFFDFSKVNRDILERAQAFGDASHKMTALDDIDNLDIESLDPQLLPDLNAWRKFKLDYKVRFNLGEIEQAVWSLKWRFRGTPDRLPVIINGKLTLLDIKTTTTLYPALALQLGGYKIAWEEMHKKKIKQRWCVQLREDSTYAIKEYKDLCDEPAFLAALQLYNWKKINLKGEKP